MNTLKLRPLEIEYHISIMPYEIDVAGIVSNITYIRWLENMRVMILEKHFPIVNMLNNGILPTLGKTEIEYRKPLTFFNKVTGKMWVSSIGEKKIVAEAEFLVGDSLHAIASQVGFLVDKKTMRSINIPEEIKELYDNWDKQQTM